MRCLLTADLHYALKQYDWLMDVAPHFDLVIIAGDDLGGHVHFDISPKTEPGSETVATSTSPRRICTSPSMRM